MWCSLIALHLRPVKQVENPHFTADAVLFQVVSANHEYETQLEQELPAGEELLPYSAYDTYDMEWTNNYDDDAAFENFDLGELK